MSKINRFIVIILLNFIAILLGFFYQSTYLPF